MRRAVAGLTAAVLVLLASSVAVAETANYKDKFTKLSSGYSGNDGSLEWGDDWSEVGDQSDDPTEGKVRVVKDGGCPETPNCLAVLGGGLNLNTVGASRPADLEGFTSAQLSFEVAVKRDPQLGITTASLLVQMTDGIGWDTVGTYVLATYDGGTESIAINEAYLVDDFAIRLVVVSGILAGDVLIDQVEVSGTPAPTTTSSTSTTSTTLPTTTSSVIPTTTSSLIPPTVTTQLPTTPTTSENATSGNSTTSTTNADTSATSPPSAGSSDSPDSNSNGDASTTSNTNGTTTTTLEDGALAVPGGPSGGAGLREPAVGLQADFEQGMYGLFEKGRPQVLGAEFDADYAIAVEVIRSSWLWLVGLALLIAVAIVSGLDRRRSGPEPTAIS